MPSIWRSEVQCLFGCQPEKKKKKKRGKSAKNLKRLCITDKRVEKSYKKIVIKKLQIQFSKK